ncbi:hypothetical protein ABID96_003584 [Bacillus sp. OAE603]
MANNNNNQNFTAGKTATGTNIGKSETTKPTRFWTRIC